MAKTNHPNIVVYFTDQQRWDTAGCYGNPMGLTPNLDAMAATGTRVENAFTCQPVCAPARASLQTGLYATAAGVWRNGINPLPQDRRTLAHYFSEAGYDTAYIGKWHLAVGAEGPVTREFRGGYDFWRASNALEFTSHPNDGILFDNDNKPIRLHGYRVDAMTDIALDYLRRPHQKPFLLFLSYLEPHFQNDMARFVAPDGYAERYRNGYIPPDLARDTSAQADWKQELPDYYGCCKSLDENLGRVRAELLRLGLAENTIVVFTSDHGCHFRTRNDEYKRSCHESSVRIPLVWSGPGFAGGKTLKELVSLVDVPTTLMSACGIPIPPGLHGRDMTKLLSRDGAAGWRRDVFIQISESHVARALRTSRWKYSAQAPDADGLKDPAGQVYLDEALYDLEADPYEQVNLIGQPRYADILVQLRRRLIELIVEAGEERPVVLPAP
jgi:arylsulfatase A-like enzyme